MARKTAERCMDTHGGGCNDARMGKPYHEKGPVRYLFGAFALYGAVAPVRAAGGPRLFGAARQERLAQDVPSGGLMRPSLDVPRRDRREECRAHL